MGKIIYPIPPQKDISVRILHLALHSYLVTRKERRRIESTKTRVFGRDPSPRGLEKEREATLRFALISRFSIIRKREAYYRSHLRTVSCCSFKFVNRERCTLLPVPWDIGNHRAESAVLCSFHIDPTAVFKKTKSRMEGNVTHSIRLFFHFLCILQAFVCKIMLFACFFFIFCIQIP